MREKRLLLKADSKNKEQRNTRVKWFDSIGEEEDVNVEVSDEVLSNEIVNDRMDFEKVDWFDSLDMDNYDNGVIRTDFKDEKEDASTEKSVIERKTFTKTKVLPVLIMEKNNCSLLAREKLVAIQYRKLSKSKTPAKFTVVSSNVYPTCACQGTKNALASGLHCRRCCQGTKNGCKTQVCICVWFGQECDVTCGCRDNCPNMEITGGKAKRINIGTSGVHGAGCFAEEDIGKGEYVGEYLGEIVARFDQEQKRNQSKFLMETGDKDYLLDASRFGSKLAKMNHRMERMGANCEFRRKRVAGQCRVGVWALKDIKEGDELFTNYGYNYRGHGLITPFVKKTKFLQY